MLVGGETPAACTEPFSTAASAAELVCRYAILTSVPGVMPAFLIAARTAVSIAPPGVVTATVMPLRPATDVMPFFA